MLNGNNFLPSPTGVRHPTPTVTLAAAGMNDVLDDRAYTQAAWWNRIPRAAWDLMISIAVLCNVLMGYGAHRSATRLFLILPLAGHLVSPHLRIWESPHGGSIRVLPQNLSSLAESLQSKPESVYLLKIRDAILHVP